VLVLARRVGDRHLIWLSLRLSHFQLHLAKVGGFGWIHSGLQVGFFNKVTPAGVTVFRALPGFEVFDPDLSVLPALDYEHDSSGLVSPDIMPDDGVGSFRFVACQRHPFNRWEKFEFWYVQITCPPVGCRGGHAFYRELPL